MSDALLSAASVDSLRAGSVRSSPFDPAPLPGCGCPFCGGAGAPEVEGQRPQAVLFERGAGVVTGNGKPSFTSEQAAAQLTRSGLRWEADTDSSITYVSYAFRATAPVNLPSETTGFSRFSAQQITIAELALQGWSDAANIVFSRVSSGVSQYSDAATILFSNYSKGPDGAAAFAYFPGSRAPSAAPGDIWIGPSGSNLNPQIWEYGFQILTHEIGHAIGLSHPSVYNANGEDNITYAVNASYYQDARQYSSMSYFASSNTGANLPGFAAVPQLDDIAAAQRLYGPNMTTRTGDTIYGFNSTAERPWFVSTVDGPVPVFAVWDAGGTDTLDFSGYTADQAIDLRQGAFSNIGGFVHNVAVAVGAVIENAIGGSGADLITGNASANVLSGGLGADSFAAGEGADKVFGEDGNDFAAGHGGDDALFGDAGDDALFGNSGLDTLLGGDGADFIDGQEDADFLLGGEGADQVLGGAGVDLLGGEAGDDRLNGGDDGDNLYGEAGFDVILGESGDDFIDGGMDGDFLLGGFGNDRMVGGAGGDLLGGEDGVDRLNGGDDGDNLYGGSGADDLFGEAGGDFLSGQDGDDVLGGGGGSDRLNGGPGSDRYLFFGGDSTSAAPDVIEDFFSGGDVIDLRFIDANTLAGGDQAFVFLGRQDSGSAIGTLRVGAGADGAAFLFGYTDGDALPDLVIQLNTFQVSGSDILL